MANTSGKMSCINFSDGLYVPVGKEQKNFLMISNGNRTEWSPIRSVIIQVITKSSKSDDRAAGVQFVYHEYNYRLNWTTRSPIIN